MNKPDKLHRVEQAGSRERMAGIRKWLQENRLVQEWMVRKWAIILMSMAFLLGRALILGELAPFAVAYFAVIYYARKDLLPWAGVALAAGSSTSGIQGHAGFIVLELLVFVLIQKALEKFERSDVSFLPVISLASVFLVQLFANLVNVALNWYTFMMIGVEAVLAFILTLIFIQALPVLMQAKKRHSLRNEEMICLMILLASVMTGTVGWILFDVSVEHVLSRYLILLFALVGGAPLGASVGVITGLILSLADMEAIYQMSLLAFAGLLAGLLKDGGKIAVSLGMVLGSSILTVYVEDPSTVLHSTMESAIAVLLFWMTSRKLVKLLAKFVPGTQEHIKTHYEYAKRVRDLTAERVRQFSDVFRNLSKSFKQGLEVQAEQRREADIEHFMNEVTTQICAKCFKHKQCWGNQSHQTYAMMTDMMAMVEEKGDKSRNYIAPEWEQACRKVPRVLDVMREQVRLHRNNQRWKQQIAESRQLVADQLVGVSQVMEDLAREIQREGHELYLQEEQIRQALEQLGLSIVSIDVISLEEGNVEIEIVHQYSKGFDECRKIIAPLLSDILGENIVVKEEVPSSRGTGYYTVTFGSAKEYEVETGVAGAAKGGDLLSGDSFSTAELGNGKFVVALSDGMGNGERARAESSTALSILQQLLQSGMDEKLAIKSVNSVLLLRSPDEMYATVDMALIDLYTAGTTFMKIGSTPSFIKRGNEVIAITANNLPVGILNEIEVDLISVQLKPGDTLIMMTDGLYEAPRYAVNKELWMKRVIGEIEAEDPQQFADCLLERIVRERQGEIEDDMTVIVAKIAKYKPQWSTFRWPGLDRLERPRTVS